jgi:hypothetical protein
VRFREASANEPLMRCRNEIRRRQNWGLTGLQDKSRREPVYCLDGAVRHRSGVNLMALAWNVGTCRSDDKGETQIGGPTRVRVPMRSTGADQLVGVLKSL